MRWLEVGGGWRRSPRPVRALVVVERTGLRFGRMVAAGSGRRRFARFGWTRFRCCFVEIRYLT